MSPATALGENTHAKTPPPDEVMEGEEGKDFAELVRRRQPLIAFWESW